MVDVLASNAKLKVRAAKMVADLADIGEREAEAALSDASGHVKTAILLAKGASIEHARDLLAETGGHLGPALQILGERRS